MLIVETIAKIRLAYFSRKMTIKAICRDLRVSRKVVRKVIRSQATEFRYQRDVQPQPKIGPWRERLDSLLLENCPSSHDLRHFVGFREGGSESLGVEVMRRAVGAASDDLRWSGA